MSNQIPILSHFTTIEAFKKILKSKALWLMPYQDMNDPAEGLIFNEYFLTYLREQHPRKLNHWQKIINDWCSRKSPDAFNNSIYLASFVSGEMEEYFLLNQWAQYGKDGCGVYIEFDFSHFFANHEIFSGISLHQHAVGLPIEGMYLTKVTYLAGHNDAQIIPAFESLIQQEAKELKQGFDNECYLPPIIFTINRLRASIKQKSFSQEQEWRIVIAKLEEGEKRFFRKAYCSIHGPNRYEMPLVYNNQVLLKSITLGPRFFEYYCIDCIKDIAELLSKLLSKGLSDCYKMIHFSRDISMTQQEINYLKLELKQTNEELLNNFVQAYSE